MNVTLLVIGVIGFTAAAIIYAYVRGKEVGTKRVRDLLEPKLAASDRKLRATERRAEQVSEDRARIAGENRRLLMKVAELQLQVDLSYPGSPLEYHIATRGPSFPAELIRLFGPNTPAALAQLASSGRVRCSDKGIWGWVPPDERHPPIDGDIDTDTHSVEALTGKRIARSVVHTTRAAS